MTTQWCGILHPPRRGRLFRCDTEFLGPFIGAILRVLWWDWGVRQIGEIDNEADAKRFSDYLNASGIAHDLQDEDTGSWLVWVHEEDLLAKAEEQLNDFLKDPTSSRYPEATKIEDRNKPEEAPPILPKVEAVPPMPLKVALAIKLIYIQVVISIVYSLFLPFWGGDAYRAGAPELGLDADGLYMFLLCASVIGGLVACFFAHNIGKGRNWARIILTVLTIGGIFLVGINGQGIVVMLEIGNTILSSAIVGLLFQKPSSDWFKEMTT